MRLRGCFTKRARRSLEQHLGLPATGQEQDWDIELADPNRLEEFVDFYDEQVLDEDKKFALMGLIIASTNELMENREISENLWSRISTSITEDIEIHVETVRYWALEGESDRSQCFAVTMKIRDLV